MLSNKEIAEALRYAADAIEEGMYRANSLYFNSYIQGLDITQMGDRGSRTGETGVAIKVEVEGLPIRR